LSIAVAPHHLSRVAALLWLPALLLAATIVFEPDVLAALKRLRIRPDYQVYSVAIAGLLLSLRFRRGRIFIAVAALLAAYVIIAWRSTPNVPVRQAATIGVMVVFVALGVLRDRSVLSANNMRLLAWLVLGFVVIATIPEWWRWSWARTLVGTIPAMKTVAGHSPLVTGAFLLAALLFASRAVARQSAVDAGLLVAMLALAMGLRPGAGDGHTALFFAVAALLLQASVIQDSYARVYIDELTGLPGRRALDEQLQALGRQYVVAMVDIDHFKQFNDRYGHDTGDQALRFVATRLTRVRGGGRVYRYGGEEFTIVFPRRDLADVKAHLEDIRQAVADAPFTVRGLGRPRKRPEEKPGWRDRLRRDEPAKTVPLTVSIGAAVRNDKSATPELVIKAADKKLYKAKRDGRNRVCV
jgi:GGDEF domain-containing protein